jgi:hypothetical protein
MIRIGCYPRLTAHSHSESQRVGQATTTQSGSKIACTVYPKDVWIRDVLRCLHCFVVFIDTAKIVKKLIVWNTSFRVNFIPQNRYGIRNDSKIRYVLLHSYSLSSSEKQHIEQTTVLQNRVKYGLCW